MAMAMTVAPLSPPFFFCCFHRRTRPLIARRNSASRPIISSSSSSSASSPETSLARDDLLSLLSQENRGLSTQKNPIRRAEIVRSIQALQSLQQGMISTVGHDKLSATWRMLWTTEKEQLFIIEKASLFGTEAGDILQVIDVAGGKLNNVITFPPDGAFIVNSTIEVVSSQRVNFKFTSAKLRGSGWNIPIPPFGQGWFDSIYLDDMIRIAKDIRGDYLIVEKAPYSWKE